MVAERLVLDDALAKPECAGRRVDRPLYPVPRRSIVHGDESERAANPRAYFRGLRSRPIRGVAPYKGGVRPCVSVDDTRVMILLDNTRMDLLEFDKEFTKFDHWKLRFKPEPVEVGKLAGKERDGNNYPELPR